MATGSGQTYFCGGGLCQSACAGGARVDCVGRAGGYLPPCCDGACLCVCVCVPVCVCLFVCAGVRACDWSWIYVLLVLDLRFVGLGFTFCWSWIYVLLVLGLRCCLCAIVRMRAHACARYRHARHWLHNFWLVRQRDSAWRHGCRVHRHRCSSR